MTIGPVVGDIIEIDGTVFGQNPVFGQILDFRIGVKCRECRVRMLACTEWIATSLIKRHWAQVSESPFKAADA